MARPRSVPDETVFDAVQTLIREGGEKAVTFAAVGTLCGLAPSSLAERHGSVASMIVDARAAAWAQMEAATAAALATAPLSPKGAISVLKALPDPSALSLSGNEEQALRWRAFLETSLAARLGGGERGRAAAVILLGYWLGDAAWRGVGHRAMRLKDVLRALL